MNVELLSLQQALVTCRGHREALQDALDDLKVRNVDSFDFDSLSKTDRRLLDQFAYRYTRLQDDMGARFLPSVLRVFGENVTPMSTLDRLNRLEQLGLLPSADEWAELRRVRNEFTHDYPEVASERNQRFRLALASAYRVSEIFDTLKQEICHRFPEID